MTDEMNLSHYDRQLTMNLIASLEQHSRTMAALCECLAMNAENMWAAILNESPRYLEKDYHALLLKWRIVSDGEDSSQ